MSTQYYPACRQNCAASCMQIMSNIGATKLTKKCFPKFFQCNNPGRLCSFFFGQDKYYEIHQCIQHILCDWKIHLWIWINDGKETHKYVHVDAHD